MSGKREMPDWENLYRTDEAESMPWFYPELDHDFDRELGKQGITSGRALDLGTGPGTQAMALAKRGFAVTATDISGTAVRKAGLKADEKGLKIEFLQDDILKSRLGTPFDLIVDRGCFHVLHEEERGVYVRIIHRLLSPGGHLFLKCFSHKEKREEGPYRFSPDEIRSLFTGQFRILSVEESVFHGTLETFPKALFFVMQKS